MGRPNFEQFCSPIRWRPPAGGGKGLTTIMALLLLALPLLPAQAIPTTHLPATVTPRARATPHPHRSVHEAKIVHRFVPERQAPAPRLAGCEGRAGPQCSAR